MAIDAQNIYAAIDLKIEPMRKRAGAFALDGNQNLLLCSQLKSLNFGLTDATTFFDALRAFIYQARRAIIFSRAFVKAADHFFKRLKASGF